jgi:hypothetical protein
VPSHSFNKYGMEIEREFDNVVEPGGWEVGWGGAGRGNGSSSSEHAVALLALEVYVGL